MRIINGDCLEVLKTLPDESVDSIVTDPPYELGFMGKKWDNTGIAYNIELWKECLRVLKSGGHLLAFSGTRTYHRMAVAIEDAGFEVRDMIEWVYGSGFPKSLSVGKAINKLEIKEWSKIGKALDNIDQESIMEVWKRNSNNVRVVETQSLKNQIIAGQDMPNESFVPVNVAENINQENLNLLVSFAEQNLNEVQVKITKTNTALQSVEAEIRQLQNNVKSAEKQSLDQNLNQSMSIFTAQCDVKEWLNENTEVNHKVDEALKTLRGNEKYSNEEITSVLCAVLPSVLKHTILNQSKTFQILDTNLKMECASAINVIITEYTAENLISNTVAILKSKAVDKLQGNEREVVGIDNNAERFKKYKEQDGNERKTFNDEITKGTSEWEGWGTALKPSHESICVAHKPLDNRSVILYNCKVIVGKLVRRLKCLLPLNVKIAELSLGLSQAEQKGVSSIAVWCVVNNTNIQESLSVLMDILQSKETESLNLNTVLLCLNFLKEIYEQMNTFTIEMETSLIIELKTLNSLLSEDTLASIIQAKSTKPDGRSANVCYVENYLNAVSWKWNATLTHSAQENVISKESKLNFAPSHEPICMARKPLSEKTVAENILKWGTGGINIDESRVATEDKMSYSSSEKQGVTQFGTGTTEQSPLGRFPANLIHDNSEEVRECFPETKVGARKAGQLRHTKDGDLNFTGNTYTVNDYPANSGNASRFFKSIIYQAKASKSERNKGCEELEEKLDRPFEERLLAQCKICGNKGLKVGAGKQFTCGHTEIEYVKTEYKPSSNNHPTVKPIALMEYLIKMVTPKKGTVLDPFMGSGTTGVASKNLSREFIGIELDPEYYKIAESRINNTISQVRLDDI